MLSGMVNRLAGAVSPYLRSHADNPVDWYEWGAEPFAAAAQRNVPVLVSIGYSTCHWCHVMARESFSDPVLAAYLNENFVAIKVDREEHPDVDSSFLAAAGAFTGQLGWPLNVFVTPEGKAFFAGTYWPPAPLQGHPAFRQVLDAVAAAWADRRDEVESNAAAVANALAAQGEPAAGMLPSEEDWVRIIGELSGHEDPEFGGFGGAPKFPVTPVLLFLLDRAATGGPLSADAAALAERTLAAMAASELRDPVEGGFFRYSTMRNWTDPHYERMLYDNAMLLDAYARISDGLSIAEGIAGFLEKVLRVDGGVFASAQDSESIIDRKRVEGAYYRMDAAARAEHAPPALDAKVLTGWNGLAIGALAEAGFRHGRKRWVALAREAAEYLLEHHFRLDGSLVRASIGDIVSTAKATLEDYGMFAAGLLRLALATGEVGYAARARELVDASLSAGRGAGGAVFRVPGGADPVLQSQGLALAVDPSEGAYPSGLSAMAGAAHTLYLLTGDAGYLRASATAMQLFAPLAVRRPISFGASLGVMTRLAQPAAQLVIVADEAGSPLASVAHRWERAGSVTATVTSEQGRAFASAGFELFEGRVVQGGRPTAYLCRDFVCRLPLTDPEELAASLRDDGGASGP
jgi:hypothetical protein